MIKIEELVEKAKNGDEEAYSELIMLVKDDLYKIARAKLGNNENVQDAIQNTIINAYFNIGKLRNDQYFKTWITRILINECNRIYKNIKREDKLIEKYINNTDTEECIDDTIDFDSIIMILDENKKKIFELYYKYGLSVKEISKKLNISETNIKSDLYRGRQKIKKSYKSATIFLFILCIFIATSVIAACVISYIKSLFEVGSVGINNDGILMAIENLDWYQETNMDYIDLGDGNKIKVEYLLMDEMNLYLIFDFESEKDISKYSDISLLDLKIVDEDNNVICNRENVFAEQYCKIIGTKSIENNSNNIKALIYIYTDGFPASESLNISFSKIVLAKKMDTKEIDNTIVNFKINLDEKFVNRKYTTYISENGEIKKSIITETGFYSIIKGNDDISINEVSLIDEAGEIYECYYSRLSEYDSNCSYIIIGNYYDTKNEKLKLVINDNEYILKKNEN